MDLFFFFFKSKSFYFVEICLTFCFRLRGHPGDVCLSAEEESQSPVLDHVPSQEVCSQYSDFPLVLSAPASHRFFSGSSSSSDWSLETLLHRWNLDCVEVPLGQFGADKPELAGSSLPGRHSIQMMIISRAEDTREAAVLAEQD